MGFLDNLTEKITQGTEIVAKKAKEVSEVAALTATVEKEKLYVEKLYNELGKKCYELYKEELRSRFPEEVEKIDSSMAKIDESKEKIKASKGTRTCPGCGKEVDKETNFCPACGAVIAREEENFETSEETTENTEE